MARERRSPGQLAGHRSPPQRSVNVGRLAPVPSPISAPSIMAAGISATGPHQVMLAPYASRRGRWKPTRWPLKARWICRPGELYFSCSRGRERSHHNFD
jgi:hypothetical protein